MQRETLEQRRPALQKRDTIPWLILNWAERPTETTFLVLFAPAKAQDGALPISRPTTRETGSCLLDSKFESPTIEADGGAAVPDANEDDGRLSAMAEVSRPGCRQEALSKQSPSVSFANTRLGGKGPRHCLRAVPEHAAGPTTSRESLAGDIPRAQGDSTTLLDAAPKTAGTSRRHAVTEDWPPNTPSTSGTGDTTNTSSSLDSDSSSVRAQDLPPNLRLL